MKKNYKKESETKKKYLKGLIAIGKKILNIKN